MKKRYRADRKEIDRQIERREVVNIQILSSSGDVGGEGDINVLLGR